MWIVLYSATQQAYHIETLAEYQRNGEAGDYRQVAGPFRTYEQASLAVENLRRA